jgi:hypothetical protein
LSVGAACVAFLSIITWQEYTVLSSLHQTKERLKLSVNSFDTIMKRKQILKKQELTLKEQLNFITQTKKQMQRHTLCIAHIKEHLKSPASLESFNVQSTSIELCIDCSQTQQAHEIIASMAKMPDISNLRMHGLHPTQQGASTALRLNLHGSIQQNQEGML